MERSNLAEILSEKTESTVKSKTEEEIRFEQEQRRIADERAEEYLRSHFDQFVSELRQTAEIEASEGRYSAHLSRWQDIENREGLYQTMRAVRDYFRNEGLIASMDSGDNASFKLDDDGRSLWIDATQCWAKITIMWPKE